MLTQSQIKKIIQQQISKEHKLGTTGKEHLAYTTYIINKITTQKTNTSQIQITYQYTISIETEFTTEPDNPPYTYTYEKTITLNQQGQIIKETPKKLLKTNLNQNIANTTLDIQNL